jgi:hypothetical protein
MADVLADIDLDRADRAAFWDALSADLNDAGPVGDASSNPQHHNILATLFAHVAAHLRAPQAPHPDTIAEARASVSGLSDADVMRIAAAVEANRAAATAPTADAVTADTPPEKAAV